MEDLFVVSDPVFYATLLATLIPFITALLVRYSASEAVKATVATILTIATAVMTTWVDANDAGVAFDYRTLAVAFAGALGWQRIVHSQFNKPYDVPAKLPKGGLFGKGPVR